MTWGQSRPGGCPQVSVHRDRRVCNPMTPYFNFFLNGFVSDMDRMICQSVTHCTNITFW